MKSLAQPSTITVHVPMSFAIRGGRKMIISEIPQEADEGLHPSLEGDRALRASFRSAPRQRTDNALLKALARGHRWRRMIESGEYTSITELAKAENVNQSYACRLLRLTLLAPPIVTDILDGRHASELMLSQLLKPLPVRWSEQLVVLNIADRIQKAVSLIPQGFTAADRERNGQCTRFELRACLRAIFKRVVEIYSSELSKSVPELADEITKYFAVLLRRQLDFIDSTTDELMTVEQAAELVMIGKQSIRRWVQNNQVGEYDPVERRYLVSRRRLRKYLRDRRGSLADRV